MIRVLDVCSGYSASTLGWAGLGFRHVGYSEIEPFPRAILEQRHGAVAVGWDHRHTPGSNVTPLFGDFTQIEECHVGPVDLLTGGTPCQSFSVAGKRLGLDDPRGNLTLEFLALARRLRVEWVAWENVPGFLSHDGGRTMGAFLRLLGECGYGFAWRVLDAQYVRVDGHERAVPQRRERLFVVGHLGDATGPAAVLFERESLCGHPAPRRKAGQGIAPTISARTRGGGGLGTDFDCDGGLVAHESAGKGGYAGGQEYDANLVVIPFDTTQITSVANYSRPSAGDPCHPLAAGAHQPTIAFQTSGNCGAWETGDITGALDTGTDPNSNVLVGPLWAVRRLTPTECEALMGVPRDFTAITYRGKPAADGPRYKALGNSQAVNVMRWLGHGIADVVDAQRRREAA